jgi:hypothetical protein
MSRLHAVKSLKLTGIGFRQISVMLLAGKIVMEMDYDLKIIQGGFSAFIFGQLLHQ